MKRPFGMLIRASEAVHIDTSHMTMDRVVDRIKELVLRIL
jgi:cytidylate kinase